MIGKPVDEFIAEGNRENAKLKLRQAANEFNQVFADATRAGVLISVAPDCDEDGVLKGIEVKILEDEEPSNG